jgi:hypothetical protein
MDNFVPSPERLNFYHVTPGSWSSSQQLKIISRRPQFLEQRPPVGHFLPIVLSVLMYSATVASEPEHFGITEISKLSFWTVGVAAVDTL